MNEYRVKKRLKKLCISGEVNLKYGTKLLEDNNIIFTEDNKVICYATSYLAHSYLSVNYDNQWELRSNLINKISNLLSRHEYEDNINYNNKWNKLWNNEYIQKFRKSDYDDYWLWDHNFYIASIDDLTYIYNILK